MHRRLLDVPLIHVDMNINTSCFFNLKAFKARVISTDVVTRGNAPRVWGVQRVQYYCGAHHLKRDLSSGHGWADTRLVVDATPYAVMLGSTLRYLLVPRVTIRFFHWSKYDHRSLMCIGRLIRP